MSRRGPDCARMMIRATKRSRTRCKWSGERPSAKVCARSQSSIRRKAAPAPAKAGVGKGEADPGGSEAAGQPTVPVAIELEAEWTPSRHPQIDQAQLGVHEVEVVMQAFAGIRPQEGAMRLLVVPGLVGVAGFHRRDDMHQAGMGAAHRKHLGDDVLLADVALGDVLDGNASGTGQLGGAFAHPITKRFGKSRIIKDLDLPRRKKPRHSPRIAGPRQRARDDNPVVAGEYPGEARAVTPLQALPHPPPPLSRLPPRSYPVWFRLCRLRQSYGCLIRNPRRPSRPKLRDAPRLSRAMRARRLFRTYSAERRRTDGPG